MLKLLVWLAGCAALLFAIDKLGLWREMMALAVLAAGALWMLGGALYFGRGNRGPRPNQTTRGVDLAEMMKAAERYKAAREGREGAR